MQGVAVDADGDIYITGETNSSDFPTKTEFLGAVAVQASFGGGGSDAFVAKLSPLGDALIYSTYFGGEGEDAGLGIAVDAGGNAYITGRYADSGDPDVFASKVAPNGTARLWFSLWKVRYFTAVAGESSGIDVLDCSLEEAILGVPGIGEGRRGIELTNMTSQLLVLSSIESTGRRVNQGSVAPGESYLGSVSLKTPWVISSAGSVDEREVLCAGILSATEAGDFPIVKVSVTPSYDIGNSIALDNNGRVYVTGGSCSDPGISCQAFALALSAKGGERLFGDYPGVFGPGIGNDVRVGPDGDIYVTGQTRQNISGELLRFPAVSALQENYSGGPHDAFVTRFNSPSLRIVYSTFLGGAGDDVAHGVALDGDGNLYITGTTDAPDFPATNPSQSTFGGGQSDAFVSKLNPEGSLLEYSSFLGGTGDDSGTRIAVDGSGRVYMMGSTGSGDFSIPTRFQTGRGTIFVVKVGPPADLSVEVSVLLGRVVAGTALSYDITVTNLGPSSSEGVVLSHKLPAGITFGSATSAQGSCSELNGKVECLLGELLAGASTTVNVQVTIDMVAEGAISSIAEVTGSGTDLDDANDTASVVIMVETPPTPTPLPTPSPTPAPTAIPVLTPTPILAPTPTLAPTPMPLLTPTPVPEPTPTPKPTPTTTPTPAPRTTSTPIPTPVTSLTEPPTPSPEPATTTPQPTATATSVPPTETHTPTVVPPSVEAVATPLPGPTVAPTPAGGGCLAPFGTAKGLDAGWLFLGLLGLGIVLARRRR